MRSVSLYVTAYLITGRGVFGVKRFPVVLASAVTLMVWLWCVPLPGAQISEPGGGGIVPAPRNNGGLQGVLTASPREIDLGFLGPGEEAAGVFYLRNVGAGGTTWFTEGPEGWVPMENGRVSGAVGTNPEQVRMTLSFLHERGPGRLLSCSVQLRLEAGGQYAIFHREAPVGLLRESFRFTFPGGTRTVFFQVRLSEFASASRLDVEPIRIDFGKVRPGESISRRVQVTNRGREILKWRTSIPGSRGAPAAGPISAGRYVSFLNEAAAGGGVYPLSPQLRDGLEFSGQWGEERGYPVPRGEQSSFRYRFAGTGIALLIRKTAEGGKLSVFFDEQFVALIDGYAERGGSEEILVVENQLETPHLLTVVSEGGRVVLEGLRVYGRQVQRGPRGWSSITPDSGMTTRETDYVTITLNTRHLLPGIYGEQVFFASNGGDATVELFLEVVAESELRLLDVYVYRVGSDYLFTSNPQAEASRLRVKGYQRLGIGFRLFSPGTPGTTEFLRWFNPAKGDHFYSSDPAGGKALPGYLLEGAIGNIATSRLTGTKELYRWHNPQTGAHFFTTHQSGEGVGKKGYRFEGIAGYVR